ncbi:N-acetyltransferase [Bdellovibrio bacteriovorus]|uniref:N-acetyltransferase n=1 Tax=Bdellovibrio bacteriovorus TaxID=959 RepID=UPI0009BD393D|nr:N-acetyltransferase [Bdellovibrio bacteriovorus]
MLKKNFEFTEISPVNVYRLSIGHIAENLDGKFFLKSSRPDPISNEHINREATAYQALSGIKNVMPLLGTKDILGQNFLVFPFIKEDLFDYIGKITQAKLVSEILLPLLKSLSSIHNAGYIHGDVKLENVRVYEEDGLHVFLADFGKSVRMGTFAPHRISSLSQHTPPDMTISPQLDIYSIGVLAFQLLFGIDFLKKYQMAGRDFEKIPESKRYDPHLLKFISVATEPSALYRFKSANQAINFLAGSSLDSILSSEPYDLNSNFEFYLECMRAIFLESNRSTADFEAFVGPWGIKYYERLKNWLGKKMHLVHLRFGSDLVGICEATIKDSGLGMISSIFLSPGHRGKGGAEILERSALKFFIDNNLEMATLNVTESNERAIRFYQKHDWIQSPGNDYIGAVRFTKKIKNGGKGGI